MATFKDTAGREWNLAFDYWVALDIRKAFGLNFLTLSGQGLAFSKLADDVELLINTIYVLIERQCEARGVTDENFGRAMAGDCFTAALFALKEAAISFCPPPDRKAAKVATDLITGAREELAMTMTIGP